MNPPGVAADQLQTGVVRKKPSQGFEAASQAKLDAHASLLKRIPMCPVALLLLRSAARVDGRLSC